MTKDIAKIEELPEFLKAALASNRGSENVEEQDLVMARLDQVQAVSKARQKPEPEYIPGIEEGDFYNSVSRENYGPQVNIIFVDLKIKYIVWTNPPIGKDGKLTAKKEFRGSFDSIDEANSKVLSLCAEEHKLEINFSIVRTPTHYALVKTNDGTWTPVSFSMANTKQRLNRNINSLIGQFGGDRFARKYIIQSIIETSKNGDKYYNAKVLPDGFVTDESTFRMAEEMYNRSKKGGLRDAPEPQNFDSEEAPF